jgi:hypothetical protein
VISMHTHDGEHTLAGDRPVARGDDDLLARRHLIAPQHPRVALVVHLRETET